MSLIDGWPEPRFMILTRHADGTVSRRWNGSDGESYNARMPLFKILATLRIISNNNVRRHPFGPFVVRWENEEESR